MESTQAEKLKDDGNQAFKKGEHRVAIQCYTEALALSPNEIYFSNRAAAHMAMRAYREALADSQKAVELNSKYLKAYKRMAKAQIALNALDEAQSTIQAAAAIDAKDRTLDEEKALPKTIKQHKLYATAAIANGDYQQAVHYAREILKAVPGGDFFEVMLLQSLVGYRKFKEAEESSQQ